MEPPEILVREACEDDLEAMNAIYNAEIEHGIATWDTAPWTLEERRGWLGEHDRMNPLLVAEHAGQVIGFAYVTLVSKKHGWRFTREDTIYIAPEFRGLKVGERLLGALLAALRELGVRLVVASITSSNEASIRLHQKFGFEAMGEMKNAGHKFGEWLSTTYMQLDLGEPGPLKPTW